MATTLSDIIVAVINKIAGEGVDLKRCVSTMINGTGPLQAKIDGRVLLDFVLPK